VTPRFKSGDLIVFDPLWSLNNGCITMLVLAYHPEITDRNYKQLAYYDLLNKDSITQRNVEYVDTYFKKLV